MAHIHSRPPEKFIRLLFWEGRICKERFLSLSLSLLTGYPVFFSLRQYWLFWVWIVHCPISVSEMRRKKGDKQGGRVWNRSSGQSVARRKHVFNFGCEVCSALWTSSLCDIIVDANLEVVSIPPPTPPSSPRFSVSISPTSTPFVIIVQVHQVVHLILLLNHRHHPVDEAMYCSLESPRMRKRLCFVFRILLWICPLFLSLL